VIGIAAALIGGDPIFNGAFENFVERKMTMELSIPVLRVKKLRPIEISVKSRGFLTVLTKIGTRVEPIFRWSEELTMANSAYRFDLASNSVSGVANILQTLESKDHALKAGELAKLLGVTRQHIYKMAAANSIPSFQVGTAARFDPKQVGNGSREGCHRRLPDYTTIEHTIWQRIDSFGRLMEDFGNCRQKLHARHFKNEDFLSIRMVAGHSKFIEPE
jgi:excisionase family DNA binding protein